MIREELQKLSCEKSDLKKFGITMAIALSIIGAFLFWKKFNYHYVLFIVAVIFLALGFIIPAALKYVYKAWMTLAIIMGFIMTKVIMFLLFFLIITPMGIVGRILGKKFLDTDIDKNAVTYWIKREQTEKIKTDYERQF